MADKNLVRISTYALREGITPPAVYKRIEAGKLECVIIDGVKFIKLNQNEED